MDSIFLFYVKTEYLTPWGAWCLKAFPVKLPWCLKVSFLPEINLINNSDTVTINEFSLYFILKYGINIRLCF